MSKHLTQSQRYTIWNHWQEKKQKEIAVLLGVSPSTISRELSRNRQPDGHYCPQKAESKSRNRRKTREPYHLKADLLNQVEQLIREDLSPEQAQGKLQKAKLRLSIQTIYNHIWQDEKKGGTLHQHLRLGRKYRKRYGKPDKRKASTKYAQKPSIESRPPEVAEKKQIGHWEGDTVEFAGKSGYLVTLNERVTKKTLLVPVARKTKEAVAQAIETAFQGTQLPILTLTLDNGSEFEDYQKVGQKLKCQIYFAHPYSPWERGLNENTNGLIRQYFPKKMHFSEITPSDVQRVEDKLNNRPRKLLDFSAPNQMEMGFILNQKIAFQT
jgi:transposase, IS30 family